MTDQRDKYQQLLEAAYNMRVNKINTEMEKLEVMKESISNADYERAISLLEIEKKSSYSVKNSYPPTNY